MDASGTCDSSVINVSLTRPSHTQLRSHSLPSFVSYDEFHENKLRHLENYKNIQKRWSMDMEKLKNQSTSPEEREYYSFRAEQLYNCYINAKRCFEEYKNSL